MRQTVSALGASLWMLLDRRLTTGLGLALTFSQDANMTVSVQETLDVPDTPRLVSISQTGTTATVTDDLHGLSTNDNVVITDPLGLFTGSYDVTVVDQNTYTFTMGASATQSSNVATLQSFRVFNHDTLVNISGTPPARSDGNYGYAVSAVRLKATSYTAGQATLTVLQSFGA